MMDPLMRTLYLHFYARISRREEEYLRKYLNNKFITDINIRRLVRNETARDFVSKYVVFGSSIYFRLLELKSKDAREEWGREAVHHSRNIKNARSR